VSSGKHFSDKLILHRAVVGETVFTVLFSYGWTERDLRFPVLEMYDNISLYGFPHIRYGNGRINKRTISPGTRGMYTFVKTVMASLITKEGERRKVFHLTTLSIAKIL
jgi:hypothetical protein